MSSDTPTTTRGASLLSDQLPPHLSTISPGVRPAAAYPKKPSRPGSGRSSRAGSRRESPHLGAIALSRTHSTQSADVDLESGSAVSTPGVNGHDSIRKFETRVGPHDQPSLPQHRISGTAVLHRYASHVYVS